MATVLETAAARKPRAFYAHLFDESGALTKVNGTLFFVGDDGAVVEVEPSMVNFLTVLGEMTLADAQRIDDLMNGGPAGVACGREEGRR
jgi:hypothetical protein